MIIAGGIVCLSVIHLSRWICPEYGSYLSVHSGRATAVALACVLQLHYRTKNNSQTCVAECKEEGRRGIHKCLEANNLFDVTTEKLRLYCHKLGQSMWREEEPNLLCRKPCLNNSWRSYKGTSLVARKTGWPSGRVQRRHPAIAQPKPERGLASPAQVKLSCGAGGGGTSPRRVQHPERITFFSREMWRRTEQNQLICQST